MRRTKLFLLVALGALAVPLFAASGAHADVGACAFTGAAGPLQASDPNDGGVESILTDLNQNEGLPLLDDDNGNPASPDGTYHFDNVGSPAPALCLAVDDLGEASTDTGLFSAIINSNGTYENIICGTGSATSGAGDSTTVDLSALAATGPGEDFTDANFTIQFVAGTGPLVISSVSNTDGESGLLPVAGAGVVNIAPTTGNCVNEDVSVFQASGAFAIATN